MTTAVEIAPMTEAEKADLIAASLVCFCTGLHHADADQLLVEARRIESMQPSKLAQRMRAQIAAEQDLRRAHQLLVDLGDTADAIADRLRALGIKGAQCFSNLCPLATYLENNGVTAYVSCDEITVPVTKDVFVHMDAPLAIAAFVKHFDSGVYLDLVDRELVNLMDDVRAGVV